MRLITSEPFSPCRILYFLRVPRASSQAVLFVMSPSTAYSEVPRVTILAIEASWSVSMNTVFYWDFEPLTPAILLVVQLPLPQRQVWGFIWRHCSDFSRRPWRRAASLPGLVVNRWMYKVPPSWWYLRLTDKESLIQLIDSCGTFTVETRLLIWVVVWSWDWLPAEGWRSL
jgi:hypothetical protein